MTDDQATLFEGMNIASVLLTPDLHIRMFTNAAAQIFGLQPSDVGRSLRNFSAPIPLAWLVDEIPTVLSTNRPSERTIEGADGARYRVRLMASSRKGGPEARDRRKLHEPAGAGMTKGSAHLAWDVGGQHALVRSEMLNSVSAAGSGTVWQSPAAFGLRGTDRNAGLGRR